MSFIQQLTDSKILISAGQYFAYDKNKDGSVQEKEIIKDKVDINLKEEEKVFRHFTRLVHDKELQEYFIKNFSASYHQNGRLKNIQFNDPIAISAAGGVVSAKAVSFYEDGTMEAVTIENPSTVILPELGKQTIKNRISFYPNGLVKEVQLEEGVPQYTPYDHALGKLQYEMVMMYSTYLDKNVLFHSNGTVKEITPVLGFYYWLDEGARIDIGKRLYLHDNGRVSKIYTQAAIQVTLPNKQEAEIVGDIYLHKNGEIAKATLAKVIEKNAGGKKVQYQEVVFFDEKGKLLKKELAEYFKTAS